MWCWIQSNIWMNTVLDMALDTLLNIVLDTEMHTVLHAVLNMVLDIVVDTVSDMVPEIVQQSEVVENQQHVQHHRISLLLWPFEVFYTCIDTISDTSHFQNCFQYCALINSEEHHFQQH